MCLAAAELLSRGLTRLGLRAGLAEGLVGLLAALGADAPELSSAVTAIVSGAGQLFLVKEGENLTLRYRVIKISADVVELQDLGDKTTLRLALK